MSVRNELRKMMAANGSLLEPPVFSVSFNEPSLVSIVWQTQPHLSRLRRHRSIAFAFQQKQLIGSLMKSVSMLSMTMISCFDRQHHALNICILPPLLSRLQLTVPCHLASFSVCSFLHSLDLLSLFSFHPSIFISH